MITLAVQNVNNFNLFLINPDLEKVSVQPTRNKTCPQTDRRNTFSKMQQPWEKKRREINLKGIQRRVMHKYIVRIDTGVAKYKLSW